MKDYDLLEQIGKGSFAEVFRAKKKDGKVYAVKKILKRNAEIEKYIKAEIEIVNQKLKHKNIIHIFEYITNRHIFICMEYCNLGDLNDYLVKTTPDLCHRLSFMVDMACGVNYLHSENIVHRDLKPENVLLTDNTGKIVCKISDFGISVIKMSRYDRFSSYVGSPAYMAPEVTGDKEYSHEIDIFALGLLFFAVFKHAVLANSFGDRSLIPGIYLTDKRIAFLNDILKKEKPNEAQFVSTYFDNSTTVGKLVFSMLHSAPEKRAKMDCILMNIVEITTENKLKSALDRQLSSVQDLEEQNKNLRDELFQLHDDLENERQKNKANLDIILRTVKEKDQIISNLRRECQQTVHSLKQSKSSAKQNNTHNKKLIYELQQELTMIKDENKNKTDEFESAIESKDAMINELREKMQYELEQMCSTHEANQIKREKLYEEALRKESENSNTIVSRYKEQLQMLMKEKDQVTKDLKLQLEELCNAHKAEKEKAEASQQETRKRESERNQIIVLTYTRKNKLLNEQLDRLHSSEQEKGNLIDNLKTEVDQLKKTIKERRQTIHALKEQNEKQKANYETATKKHEAERSVFSQQSRSHEFYKQNYIRCMAENDLLKSKIDEKERLIGNMRQKEKNLKVEEEKLQKLCKTKTEKYEQEIKKRDQDMAILQEEKECLITKVAKTKTEIKTLNKTLICEQEHMKEARKEYDLKVTGLRQKAYSFMKDRKEKIQKYLEEKENEMVKLKEELEIVNNTIPEIQTQFNQQNIFMKELVTEKVTRELQQSNQNQRQNQTIDEVQNNGKKLGLINKVKQKTCKNVLSKRKFHNIN